MPVWMNAKYVSTSQAKTALPNFEFEGNTNTFPAWHFCIHTRYLGTLLLNRISDEATSRPYSEQNILRLRSTRILLADLRHWCWTYSITSSIHFQLYMENNSTHLCYWPSIALLLIWCLQVSWHHLPSAARVPDYTRWHNTLHYKVFAARRQLLGSCRQAPCYSLMAKRQHLPFDPVWVDM